MRKVAAVILWIVINVLPAWLAMWILDITVPDWVERARKAKSRVH